MSKKQKAEPHVEENLESHVQQQPHNKSMVKLVTDRLIGMLVEEVNKAETQKLIRQKVVMPVITLLYNELYPYIIALACIIMALLVLSILTFVGFIIYYLKNL